MKRIIILFSIFFSITHFGYSQCTMANYMGALRIPLASYPYTSVSSGVTVSVTTVNVPTLSDFSYTCGGNTYSGSSPAWWLNSATGVITFSFSAPVTNLTVLINGVNSTEVFYYVPNTGAVTLSNFCTTGYSSVGGTLTAGATAGLGSIVTINNPTGATRYTLTHNGLGSGSRVTLLDCFVRLAPLPVELIKFKAQCRSNEKAELSWSTASEIGNDYFVIEKSTDAKNFFEVGKVKGAGNSNEIRTYTFIDINKDATAYYRLKQTDISSNYKYSEIISINSCMENDGEISMYPNPASDELILITGKENVSVIVMDNLGNVIQEKNLQRGENNIQIADIKNGSYIVKFVNPDGEVVAKRLIISHQ